MSTGLGRKEQRDGIRTAANNMQRHKKKQKTVNEEPNLRRGGRISKIGTDGFEKDLYLADRYTIVESRICRCRPSGSSRDCVFSSRTFRLRKCHLILFRASMPGISPRHFRNSPPSSCSSSWSLSSVDRPVVQTCPFRLVLSRRSSSWRRPLRPPICHGHCGSFRELVAGSSRSWLWAWLS